MKFVLSIAILLTSMTSVAQNRKSIHCLDSSPKGHVSTRASLELDQSGLSTGSGYFRIIRAFWGHQFSSADLFCQHDLIPMNEKRSIKCAGYLMGRGLLEIAFDLEQGAGSAKVRNIDEDNPYQDQTEGLVLDCKTMSSIGEVD